MGDSSPIDLTGTQDDDMKECPVCGQRLPIADLAVHCEAHFFDEEQQPQQAAAPSAEGAADDSLVLCSTCGEACSLADYASHMLAHELQEEEQRAHEDDADELADRAAEHLYFQELRAKYGFEDQVRPGNCHLCGKAGHWSRECPQAAHNRAARDRIVEPLPAGIMASQRPAGRREIPGGLIPQLAASLAAQNLPKNVAYEARLCGAVEHYEGEASDGGWGCGYRNLQMQISHLLTRQDAHNVLFGGCGFVPDIPALQAWIECAWAAGFDPQGAEQLGGRVQGTRKWIGTTEVAAVLRYFGLRACVVDFGTQQGSSGSAGTGAAGLAAGSGASGSGQPSGSCSAEVHPNVECNGCGCCPIVGPRYRSQVLPNYDLCRSCYQTQQVSPAAPFVRMIASRVQQGGPPPSQPDTGDNSQPHDWLMQWVWDYFSSAEAEQQAPASCGSKQQQLQEEEEAIGGRETGELWLPVGPGLGDVGEQGMAKRQRVAAEQGLGSSAAATVGLQSYNGGLSHHSQQQQQQQQQQQLHISNRAPHQQGLGSAPRWQQQGPAVVLTSQPPLYFQHEGHSRTIVGIERRLPGQGKAAAGRGSGQQAGAAEYTLLVLDPGCPTQPLANALERRQGWQRMLKRGQHTLRKPQYQLCYCEPGIAAQGSGEYEALKIIAAKERY